MANPLPSELIAELQQETAAPNFFQILHLLEQYYGQQLFQQVRLKPSANLNFPASDISIRTVAGKKQQLEFNLNFNGFYGVDAVLPQYFAISIVAATEESKIVRDFLNIFNERLYQLLYSAYKKSRLFWQENHALYINYLIALSGNSLANDDLTEFAFAGLLGAGTASLAGLSRLLKGFLQLDGISITVLPPAWIVLDTLQPLGQAGILLGDNSVLGSRVLDSGGKIAIEIGPIEAAIAATLLPNHSLGQRLRQLLLRYLGPLFPFEMKLRLAVSALACASLGSPLQLGWLLNLGTTAAQELMINCDKNKR